MQKSELEIMASRARLVDQALAEYGPEAKHSAQPDETGAQIQNYDLFWRGADAGHTLLKVEVALDRLGADRERARSSDPRDAGSEGRTRHGQSQSPALMEQTRTHGCPLQLSSPVRLVAGDQCDPLVDVPLLWIWGSLGNQSDNNRLRWRSARFRWRARCS